LKIVLHNFAVPQGVYITLYNAVFNKQIDSEDFDRGEAVFISLYNRFVGNDSHSTSNVI